jgi:hypothetical protein
MLLLAGRDIAIDRVSRLTESRQILQVLLRAIATVGENVRLFMGSRLSTLGPQEKRFAAYMEGLATAADTKTDMYL